MTRILAIFLLLLCSVFALGAGKTGSVPAKPGQIRMSDAEVERTIRAKYARSKINADGFTVRVQGGIAYIDGKTNVVQHKGVATRMAKTGGAAAVVNKVQVSDAARQKLAAQLEKGRVAMVKR